MPSNLKKAVRKFGRPRSNAISQPSSAQVTKVYLDCTPPLSETFFTADHPPEPLKESSQSVSRDDKQGGVVTRDKVCFASRSSEKNVESDESSSCVRSSVENPVESTRPDEAAGLCAETERRIVKQRNFSRPLNVDSRIKAISAAKHGVYSLKPSNGPESGEKTAGEDQDVVLKHGTKFFLLN